MIEEKTISWEYTIVGHKVWQVKGNTIPRDLVPPKRLFNKYDVA